MLLCKEQKQMKFLGFALKAISLYGCNIEVSIFFPSFKFFLKENNKETSFKDN